MALRIFLLAIGLLAILVSVKATAQDQGIEAAIEQSRSSSSNRELQAQASAQPPTTDDRHELAIFYHKRGIANHRLGNYSSAVTDLRLALENIQPKRPTPDGWGGRFRIQNDLGNAYEARSDWFSAIDLWNSMAQEFRQSNPIDFHFAQLRLMSAYSVLAQWTEADKARQEADAMLPRLRSAPGWARSGFNSLDQHNQWTGVFFSRQGNYAEAERSYRASLESAEKFLDVVQRTYGKDHQQVRIASTNVRVAKTSLADNLSTQGKYAEAEAYAREGLEHTLALYGFNTTPVGYALAVVAWTRFQQGDLVGAEKYRRHALAAVEGSGVAPHSTGLAARRANLAEAHLVQGRWSDALKLYDERDRGLRSDAAQFKRTGSRTVGWAYALHKTGQSERAAQMAEGMAATALKRPVPNRWQIAQVRGVLGMALASEGRTAEALKAYRESIPELIRRDQDDATAENTGFWRAFWQRVILEAYLELLAKLQVSGEAVAALDLIDESFRIADIARGSSVQEAINATAARAQLPDKNLAELARKEQDALNRIVALNRVLSGLAAAPADERTTKILSDVRTEIERLRREHVALRSDIRNRFPEYADLIDPRPAGISDVRKALAAGEALVSIYVGDSQSYVWTIAAGGKAAFRVVSIKRVEIEADVRELRRAVDLGEGNVAQIRAFDLGRAHKLYLAFFAGDEALWKDAQVLNVIPHGVLGQLPFALLVTAPSQQPAAGAQSAYREVPWLLRKIAIAQLPSASAFAALRRTPPGKAGRQPFVGFGDPMFITDAAAGAHRGVVRNLTVRKIADSTEQRLNAMAQGSRPQAAAVAIPTLAQAFLQLSALPDTSDELREIAATLKTDASRDVFVNRRATEKNVKQPKLDNTRVVAFATHGIAPGELSGLGQPALALSNPALTGDSENDGFLTMEEVLGLKLDADWVVLSACNTGSADGRGSEAVSGLGRAFFYAGARSLLVSNWAVETTSARLLTTELFRRQAENPQLTRAEALRQSMLALMGRSATGVASFSYAHPAFWAPFTLVGDGGR